MPDAPSWSPRTLGERRFDSPLGLSSIRGNGIPVYVDDDARVLCDVELDLARPAPDANRSFEKAGPRSKIFFDPKDTRAAILTAGGLCPGINNVIRSLVLMLVHAYEVRQVLGIRFGFAGLVPGGQEPIVLDHGVVETIHSRGGTILGTSRGQQDVSAMVDELERREIGCLFAIGGDGTMRGTHAIAEEVARRGLSIAVIGIPKTIDNDVAYVDKTFGFETAVAMARIAVDAAHTEALSSQNGIGLVKLMGREAGFIAAHATLASHDVNVCLVPEVPYRLEGPKGLLAFLEGRLEERGHAVVVVAEGCGAHLVPEDEAPHDASGNVRLSSKELDIGAHLKRVIDAHFARKGVAIALKYIDPSYMIRGVPANAVDAVFCDELARYAAHAAMAGKTDIMIGRLHRCFTHVPLPLALGEKKRIDPDRELWLAVTETTGQPKLC